MQVTIWRAESRYMTRPQDNIQYVYLFEYPYIPAGEHVYTYLNACDCFNQQTPEISVKMAIEQTRPTGSRVARYARDGFHLFCVQGSR